MAALARPVRMEERFFLTDSMDLPMRSSASSVTMSISSAIFSSVCRKSCCWCLVVKKVGVKAEHSPRVVRIGRSWSFMLFFSGGT